jgi:hypothetical protein
MVSIRTKGYAWGMLQIQADFAKPEDIVLYRRNRKDVFMPSPVTVALALHNPAKACTLINQWLRLEPQLKPVKNNRKGNQ